MSYFAELMEGPIYVHRNPKGMRQIGWLGHSDGMFYPWKTPLEEIHRCERGGYTPVYIEVDDE